jgi:hypothetical protein
MNAPTYRIRDAEEGGLSRTDGINVPNWKIMEIITG